MQYLKTLSTCSLFCGMGESELRQLIQNYPIQKMRFVKGESIEDPEHFFRGIGIVLDGALLVKKESGQAKMIMSVLQTGSIFGAASLFSTADDKYAVSIAATKPTTVYLIDETTFREMMKSNFVIAENYVRYLTGRVRFLSQRLDTFVQPTIEDKLLLFLQDHAKDGTCQFPFGMQALADCLCISRATLYRAIDALQADGKLIREHKRFILISGEERE